jgi:hypothetical protein
MRLRLNFLITPLSLMKWIKNALTKANCFEWVHFGEYVDIKRKGCPPTAQASTKTKKVIIIKKTK